MENSELCKAGIEHKYILYWTGEKSVMWSHFQYL